MLSLILFFFFLVLMRQQRVVCSLFVFGNGNQKPLLLPLPLTQLLVPVIFCDVQSDHLILIVSEIDRGVSCQSRKPSIPFPISFSAINTRCTS